jgi:large subunit ribosomal protein L22
MIAKAKLNYIRITPRKFRMIIPLVKGKSPEEAIAVLMTVKRGASKYAIDLLNSAIANAKRSNQGIDVSTLYVSKLIADCGPTLKRFRAASMGRAGMIRKRTSHITLELDQRKDAVKEDKPKAAAKGQVRAPAVKKAVVAEKKPRAKPAHIKKGKE